MKTNGGKKSGDTLSLKGQCQEIFDHFYLLTRFDLGPIWRGKNDFVNFFVFVCQRSQQLRQHRVSVVNNYADIVSA